MAFRNPLRSGNAVLFCTSLAACVVTIACNVYDEDELLRRPHDDGGSQGDAASGSDAMTRDGAPRLDGLTPETDDANARDATLTDAHPDGDNWTSTDVSAPDVATSDTNGTRDASTPDGATPDGVMADATGTDDAADAGLDANTGARDADAGAPTLDANDGATRDALGGADADAREGGSNAPDATTDVDGATPPPTFRVVSVGDGTAQLSAASTTVFIEERDWDGQRSGRPLALPTSASGSQRPLTVSGIASSEGALAVSLDGRYLTLAGYATATGHANVATSNDVERVVARVDAAGVIDTSTHLGQAFSGGSVRSAASADGTSFWIAGASGGVWYFPLGGAGAQVAATPDNVRLVALFDDRLYGCSGASPMTSVFTVGAGRPTTGGQSVAALAGMPQSGMSPYAFALFDRSATVTGLDTLYLTDDRSPESDGTGGGIQKWTFDGSSWSRVATFATVGSGTASFRGLAGSVTPNGVMLVASTAETSANRLVVFDDDGSSNPGGRVIATAASNTIFRGVALSPHP